MFEPKDTGEGIWMKLAVATIILILFLMALELNAIFDTLKAQPTEFIQQLHTELNP